MRGTLTWLTCLLIQSVAWLDGSRADEPRAAIPPELILESFSVAKGGEALVVPVTIDGKQHPFIVDTGAQKTIFDMPLLKGSPKKTAKLQTPGKPINLKEYDPPQAWVGKIPFPLDGTILSMDFQGMREAFNLPIEGILGQDFLGKHVVHVNFDQGEFLLLNSVPEGGSEILPMYWKPGTPAFVLGMLTGSEWLYFVIDTGLLSAHSGSVITKEAGRLVSSRKLLKIGDELSEIASGRQVTSLYRGIFLKVGSFAVEDPLIGETNTVNLLGLGFWSRFVVTFDFPGRRVLLAKGQNFKRSDEWNRSGITLLPRNDAVRIEHVSSDSAGLKAGAKAGDILLEVGGLKATQKNLDEVGERLGKPGRVECVVQRDGKEHRLTLVVPE